MDKYAHNMYNISMGEILIIEVREKFDKFFIVTYQTAAVRTLEWSNWGKISVCISLVTIQCIAMHTLYLHLAKQ